MGSFSREHTHPRRSGGSEPALHVVCLASGGGPSEDNVTGFLVRATATNWKKGSVLSVDAGSHLAAITRLLESSFPLVSSADPASSESSSRGPRRAPASANQSWALTPNGTARFQDDAGSRDSFTPCSSRSSSSTPEPELTTLTSGPFAGLPFPHASARANALHVVRECVSTYLITHPHLDHLSAFAINTAAFHNTSRPKRLAALPSTVNAIKAHIFNDVIWPNLTDEDGGVGFVTFQRLVSGGNIAVGEGASKGYIEVCDGLCVKGLKVSHGHCTRGPASDRQRGSDVGLSEAMVHKAGHGSAQQQSQYPPLEGFNPFNPHWKLRTPSLTQFSAPGTPGLTSSGAPPAGPGDTMHREVVVDSTAYFIREEGSGRELLFFGDVEPDELSLNPRTAQVWAEAAPKIASGLLRGVFIECSYDDSQGDAVLFGHLAPRHLFKELTVLAEMVRAARVEARERREARKRKRSVAHIHKHGHAGHHHSHSHSGVSSSRDETSTHSNLHIHDHGHHQKKRRRSANPTSLDPMDEEDVDTNRDPPLYSPEQQHNHNHNHQQQQQQQQQQRDDHKKGYTSSPLTLELTREIPRIDDELPPLTGLTVIVMHVKDTLRDGPLVGDSILAQLRDHEKELKAADGRGLGCEFVISAVGGSYFF